MFVSNSALAGSLSVQTQKVAIEARPNELTAMVAAAIVLALVL